MTNFSARSFPQRYAAAAAFLVLVAACGFPGMKVDNSGLGNTPIGQLLTRTWMNSPEWIAGQVREMLRAQAGGAPTVASAQAIGFECGATLPTCKYRGHVNYRMLNLPAENAAHEYGMESFSIEITSENPLVIHTNKVVKD